MVFPSVLAFPHCVARDGEAIRFIPGEIMDCFASYAITLQVSFRLNHQTSAAA
jgi:hypothetical protein